MKSYFSWYIPSAMQHVLYYIVSNTFSKLFGLQYLLYCIFRLPSWIIICFNIFWFMFMSTFYFFISLLCVVIYIFMPYFELFEIPWVVQYLLYYILQEQLLSILSVVQYILYYILLEHLLSILSFVQYVLYDIVRTPPFYTICCAISIVWYC